MKGPSLKIAFSFLLLVLPATAADPGAPRAPASALAVPLVAQATNYTCGSAALLSTLLYWNRDDEATEEDIAIETGATPDDGTPPGALIAYARSKGLEAELKEHLTLEDLRAALRAGETWILMIQAWSEPPAAGKPPLPPWSERWNDGHYVVLTAMDGENAFFMDPSTRGRYAYIPLQELLDRWHDYDFDESLGEERRYFNAAIRIRGETARAHFPAPLERMH